MNAQKTIAFDVLNRFTGAVQFTAQITCAEAATPALKLGLAVRWAIKSGADLSGADLSRADLSGADLSGADLSGADLSGADLSWADLSGADLSGADLSRAYLSRADLSWADLSGADLSGADLSRADLSRADLSRANLSRADLSRADLSGAYLSGADLSRADLSRADLSRANLSGADLSGADLSEEALRPFKADLWLTLTELAGPREAQDLIAKLKAGAVNGATYGGENQCACLVGTIANAKGVSYTSLSHNADRPAERWFMSIKTGDKPGDDSAGGFAAAKALEWTEQWCAALGHPTEADVQAVSA